MTRIESLEQAEQILSTYVPQVRELLGKDLTLKRMKPLMDKLGNPEDKLKIIHIAGTSGKTSTAYFIAALLKSAGKRVGLTISPHISSVTERVQIDLSPISDSKFCSELGEFLDAIEIVEPRPTYFELLVAFAYWYFAKAGVDYAVIETGLGGSFDATNIAGKSDKICVITDIGLDHMKVLGQSITEIAGQKAGIIHHGNQVFMNRQSPAVMNVFKSQTQKQKATLNVLSNIHSSREVKELDSIPAYQQRNWRLAKNVYDFVAKRHSLPTLNPEQIKQALMVSIPARMETIRWHGKTVFLDGAHNQQKMKAFVDSFQQLYPDKKADILLALKTDKEYQAVLPLLRPICNRLIITGFDTSQDLYIKSIAPQTLATAAKQIGFDEIVVEKNAHKALEHILNGSNDTVVITGSFYLLGMLRPAILVA